MRAPLTAHRSVTTCSNYRMTLPTCEPSTALRATKPPLRIPQGRSPAGSHTRSNLLCRLKVEAGKTRVQTGSLKHRWLVSCEWRNVRIGNCNRSYLPLFNPDVRAFDPLRVVACYG